MTLMNIESHTASLSHAVPGLFLRFVLEKALCETLRVTVKNFKDTHLSNFRFYFSPSKM